MFYQNHNHTPAKITERRVEPTVTERTAENPRALTAFFLVSLLLKASSSGFIAALSIQTRLCMFLLFFSTFFIQFKSRTKTDRSVLCVLFLFGASQLIISCSFFGFLSIILIPFLFFDKFRLVSIFTHTISFYYLRT